ncbi:ACD11 homolog protein-like [Lolium rigidum]|uniref:ACD11 homolog protein-like n=1 Tax=Lolium rigidum TaxID=89674 RepID=UPI001F5D2A14|nr:ACD11 homolog protein-like [Lolium rigidum]XP_051178729.1 ACD11 homolog protein isoform X1 [Lolium perenne]XP_051178730.1 ACD11 homolog protein isoform X2 [Lolium perenne]
MMGFRKQMSWSSSAAGAQAGAQADQPMCDAAAAVVAARQGMETPLTAVAEAFEELARGMEADGGELRLAPFGDTCALVSVLFNSLGIAFKFAESEYVTKVNDLIGASKEYATLNDILDKDVEHDCVKKQGSHSRNLRRVRLGLGLIKALFEQFLATEGSLYEAATTAYGQVCAPFHSWAIRKAVGAGMYTLPTREQLILRLNETDCSVQKEMRRYIDASSPIIEYIDTLFLSRNIVLDW